MGIQHARLERNGHQVWEGTILNAINGARNLADIETRERGERPLGEWQAGNVYGNWCYFRNYAGRDYEAQYRIIVLGDEEAIRNAQAASRARELDPASVAFPLPAPKSEVIPAPAPAPASAIRLADEAQASGKLGMVCPDCGAPIYASGVSTHYEIFHSSRSPREALSAMADRSGIPDYNPDDEAPDLTLCPHDRPQWAGCKDCQDDEAPASPSCPVCGINLPDHSDDCSLSAQERVAENNRLVIRDLLSEACALCGADIAGAFHSPDDCLARQASARVSYRERSRLYPANRYFAIQALREALGDDRTQAGSGIGSEYAEALRVADEALARLANFY